MTFRAFFLASLILWGASAYAAAPSGPPLMVVRFNAPNIAYQATLSDMVRKAKVIKQDVNFTLIHYVPVTATVETNGDLGMIILDLKSLGVAADHIKSERIPANVENSEVHVFIS